MPQDQMSDDEPSYFMPYSRYRGVRVNTCLFFFKSTPIRINNIQWLLRDWHSGAIRNSFPEGVRSFAEMPYRSLQSWHSFARPAVGSLASNLDDYFFLYQKIMLIRGWVYIHWLSMKKNWWRCTRSCACGRMQGQQWSAGRIAVPRSLPNGPC